MISEYTAFSLGKMKVEVNFNEASQPCKVIKFTMDGKEELVDRADFYAMMMMFADPQQMVDLIPVKETVVRAVTRLLKVRAKKDIKKGETIAVPYTHYIPQGEYERVKFLPDITTEQAKNVEAIVNHKKM